MTGKWPFSPLFVLLSLASRNGGVSPSRWPRFVGYALRFILLEPVRLAERVIYDRAIRAHELARPPVFVLGHWRSGTSYLQTLISLDPQFTTSTIYRSLFSDVFFLTERWLKPVLNVGARWLGVQYAIQRAPLDLDTPAEADLGLCSLASRYSYTWGHVFPSRFKSWLTRLVLSPTEASRAGWLDAYDYFLRKLSYASPGTGVVVKSPGDTARLVWLAERYPEAKFVTIYRDPTDVFYSNQYLWEVVLRDHGLQHLDEAQVEPLIVDTYSALQSRYQEQRKNVSPQRLVEVAYADLRDDPVKTLTKVYDQLGLGAVPTDEIEAFLRGQQAYKSPAYTRSPEMEARLAGEWAGEV